MSLLFFYVFIVCSYGIWCVLFRRMLVPKLEVSGGALLPGFVLCDEDEAGLLNGGRMCLVRGGDKYLMVTKAKDLGFLTQIHLNVVLWC